MQTCCGGLEKLNEMADWPFFRPIYVDPKTKDIKAGDWAVRLFKKTQSGGISKKSIGTIYLNFCPICGAKLRGVENDTRQNSVGN